MGPHELDTTDRRILRELQQDGALRNDILAERIGLSSAPTLRRVRALEAAGIISRYGDPERIRLGVRVKVDVRLASQTRDAIDAFSKSVSAMPEVVECMILFGEWDYQLTVVARDVDDYQRFVFDKLRGGAGRIRTSNQTVMSVVHSPRGRPALPEDALADLDVRMKTASCAMDLSPLYLLRTSMSITISIFPHHNHEERARRGND
jgi:Lrp/AsnC family transcriptional regulator, leucine-responsive regulatory protein